jgi:hypothetical protein
MSQQITRLLAQILISKFGGNVGHDLLSIIQELIDNALDANANQISFRVIEVNSKKYLIINDDGNGILDVWNLLKATKGKKGKIGCKNQGFLDILMYLSKLKGEHQIWTRHNNKYARMKIKLNSLYKEYKKQRDAKITEYDYILCQQELEKNITVNDNDDTMEFLESYPDIKEKIQENGTYIKIELDINDEEQMEYDDLNLECLQYIYTEKSFMIRYNDEILMIEPKKNICMIGKYVPITFQLYKYTSISGNICYKLTNDFNDIFMYYKKTKQLNHISKEKYEEIVNTQEDIEELVAKAYVTMLNPDDAETQRDIFDCGIDSLRKIWIESNGKILGMPSWPSKIPWTARNMKDLRMLIKIVDESYIKDITMSNKARTNINNIDNIVINFIKYMKQYVGKMDYTCAIYKKYNELYESGKAWGATDIKQYLRELNDIKPIQPVPIPVPNPPIPKPKSKKKPLPSCYFKHIIPKKKDSMIKCKFGYTNRAPNERDREYGKSWTQLTTIYINKSGSQLIENKIRVEWEIHKHLKETFDEDEIEWITKEEFNCSKYAFGSVYSSIREIMENFEEENPFI